MSNKLKQPVLELSSANVNTLRVNLCDGSKGTCDKKCDDCIYGILNIKEFKEDLKRKYLTC